ncbi:type I-E CRISPR-associated endoribonuclease Cas2e [Lactiplantibacillus plajomi]|uniref:Type I-E CRISPR-associated endoribonuclease Cas2e n=1 Tax=Lactiplantibacillus plajomi TaxID=1457217 RepID=A0ABV6K6H4_9LACO|nr:type I-E CRISPR-associated endoribonuclease Cas2e [Lactiplantibacillus plajomi]
MIVITLTNVPPSLRGDLTKWCQEIQTGVYVGHFSARIRDYLWTRVVEGIGRGEATMVYSTNNELGYEFRTTRRDYQVVDYDGLPLMMHKAAVTQPVEHGFSDAAKFRRAKTMRAKQRESTVAMVESPVVTLDLETTGLDAVKNEIIAIGAVKRTEDGTLEEFNQFVKNLRPIPRPITALTGITSRQLNEAGLPLKMALERFHDFIGDLPILGYNLRFDESFLTAALRKTRLPELTNPMHDLMPVVKEANMFLDNYQLETVLNDYGIKNDQPHNALSDAKATWALAEQLIKNGDFEI